MTEIIESIKKEFESRFDSEPIVVRSPGRVNLIGEHTDYNDGFVLPAAIDKSIILAMAANSEGQGRFYAHDKQEYVEIDISGELEKSRHGWPNYLLGIIERLRARGYDTPGVDCVFGGNVPIGAGLSSSAALEGGVLFGLSKLNGWDISPVEMAQIAQEAENQFVGVQCGIMDQFISLNGKEGHAMKLDCRSLDFEFYPFKYNDIHIVLCDTQVRRELASSEYNVRRSQCEEGVSILQKFDAGIQSLRDVSLDFLTTHEQALDPVVYRRCKYVVEENDRVLNACNDLQNNNLGAFGQRMYASHAGLRDEYEVSCEELDILVDAAGNQPGVIGARMMGGGFGGCTINLVREEYLDYFTGSMTQIYKEQTGRDLKVYKTQVAGGTHLIPQAIAKTK